MKRKVTVMGLLPALLAFAVLARAAHHEHGDEHIILPPEELEWSDGPASLPEGAEMVILEGDPGKEGMFTMRFRVPADYRIPPHTHPRTERVTVLEGELSLGMGREFDEENLERLPQGSFFVMQPGMVHYVRSEEETVIQLTSNGPWEIRYVNPADDPRRAAE